MYHPARIIRSHRPDNVFYIHIAEPQERTTLPVREPWLRLVYNANGGRR